MNAARDSILRETVASGVIACAVVAGAYMFVVDKPRGELSRVRASVQAVVSELAAAEALCEQIPGWVAVLKQSQARAEEIARRGDLARDERALFAAMTGLAAERGVSVEQLSPAGAGQSWRRGGAFRVSTPAGRDAPFDTLSPGDIIVAYSMTATGTYASLASFLRCLRERLGYAQVRLVRMTPVSDQPGAAVRAIIETEHFAFDPVPVGLTTGTGGTGGGGSAGRLPLPARGPVEAFAVPARTTSTTRVEVNPGGP